MCQVSCPMNKSQVIIEVHFNSEETKRVMSGSPYKDVPKDLKQTIALLGLDYWASTPRNLRTLFDAMDAGHVPKI